MSCWIILGIAPTRDTASIKRAYAALLKITRPDEDANAYQLLRDSYQAALDYAKAPEPPPANNIVEPDEGEQDISPASMAERLADTVLARWHGQGDAGLAAYWPEVEAALDKAPLDATLTYSTEFALLVISHPNFPAAFGDRLRQRFGWGQDVLRQPLLTPEQRLAFKARLQVVDFQVKAAQFVAERKVLAEESAAQQAAEARRAFERSVHLRYHQLALVVRQAGRLTRWKAWLITPAVRHQFDEVSAEQRAILGIDDHQFELARSIALQGARVRTVAGMLLAVVGAMAGLLTGGIDALSALLAAVCALCFFTPLGTQVEWLRHKTTPGAGTDEGDELLRTARQHARLISVLVGLMGMSFSFIMQHANGEQPADPPGVAWAALGFALWLMWCMPPRKDDPLVQIFPAMFLFCMASVISTGITYSYQIVAIAAFWHAAVYAAQSSVGFASVASLCGGIGMLIILNAGRFPHELVIFAVPWCLFVIARRISTGFALAIIATSVLFTPLSRGPAFAAWTLAVAFVWLTIWSALRFVSLPREGRSLPGLKS